MSFQIIKYADAYREQVIQTWEASVRATHHFLAAADIAFYKTIVQSINFNDLEVYCYVSDSGEVAGFLGVAEKKLEMLFLQPAYIGKGIGKQLITFAIEQLQVQWVDVNEGNTQATAFYTKAGFTIIGRTELDDAGKPYPILKMQKMI
ncbi:MAG: GNAT family N-acetyltransferase [Filimonas sp.]|nr:GNAT family N-acetyltransferase [Filimonas sp.]